MDEAEGENEGGHRLLCEFSSAAAILDYVDGKRRRSERYVRIERVEEGYTKSGTYRIWIRLREAGDTTPKTFLAHRIQQVIDPETGEVFEDPRQWLTDLIKINGGERLSDWPGEVYRTRAVPFIIPPLPRDFLPDFYFGVPRAAIEALDIYLSVTGLQERKETGVAAIITIGAPPAPAFNPGDIFHAPRMPPDVAGAPWGEQKKFLEMTVQVITADMDQVTAAVTHHDGTTPPQTINMPPRHFMEYLRTGSIENLDRGPAKWREMFYDRLATAAAAEAHDK